MEIIGSSEAKSSEDGGEQSLSLSLSLTLGGCFSSNPRENRTSLLIRSSSISTFQDFFRPENSDSEEKARLQRTCSLPVPGADEEHRKRKVMQALKRLEAKRKRNDKRVLLVGAGGGSGSGSGSSKAEEGGSSCPRGPGGRAGAAGLPPLSRTTSSGLTQGFDSALKRIERTKSVTSEMEMPCVSAKGNGPNGTRIEGFLYKYKKGEEVRIVCVCHGNFHTPAEFVRHAGGGDVEYPMRHIVLKNHKEC